MGKRKKTKIAVGQAGGPTAVINASLYGFVNEAGDAYEIVGILNGFQGLANNQFVTFNGALKQELRQSRDVPGAFLGSGRWTMERQDMVQAVQNLKKLDIHYLVFIGGNGTMWSCKELEETAKELHYDLAVIGIPKTVDNDLYETDHAPGFASAARYVALSVRDIGKDLQAMQNFESVRIIETMGRNVGWLTAASALLKETDAQPPHLIYTPEKSLLFHKFLNDISETVKTIGYAIVVVSEGIRDEKGQIISQLALNEQSQQQVLGGASSYLSRLISQETKLSSRSEILGMNQRCSQWSVAAQDRLEAEEIGKQAMNGIRQGLSGLMLTLLSSSELNEPYAFTIGSCPFEKVAGLERPLPSCYLNDTGTEITDSYRKWLRRIVGNDIQGYPDGMTLLGKIAR
ncbi:diphosphate--fructose-6-phosphate 1-phosphotransferase [Paenibacillus nasutitermitis]|uniref:Pyrophosphate--fructose 6-phosphate 1-phosphotransferase n=1 Tax=Paenibacillus nasutitermitis TaxID=1652958 RepID=A0A916YU89_9BACL|nr:diphosphate--fructose-6-phosphate 1-phosphotransferase [Paenibacillus nasutitermitis]GGD61635.1 6-phosphofructokinase [Paenibacillus nasutitermitis]